MLQKDLQLPRLQSTVFLRHIEVSRTRDHLIKFVSEVMISLFVSFITFCGLQLRV